MKLPGYEPPKSSFLSLERDCSLIINRMLHNDRLKKMLFYEDKYCLDMPNLTNEQTLSLVNKQIKLVPKITVDRDLFSYIIISFDNFSPNANNPEFRDNLITFDVICHLDSWNLGDFQLRPYKIFGEIDSMFNGQRLTGIGKLEFMGASQIILNDEFAGITGIYSAVHGEEDKNIT